MNKKLLIGLALFGFIGVGVVGGLVYTGFNYVTEKVGEVKSEAKVFITSLQNGPLSNWDPKSFLDACDSEYVKAEGKDNLIRAARLYQERLGSLQSFGEPTITRWEAKKLVGESSYVLVEAFVDAEFEKGPAKIRMGMINRGEGFKINDLMITSNTLAEKF